MSSDAGPAPDPFHAVEQQLAVLLRRTRMLSVEMAEAVLPGMEPSAYGLLIRIADVGPSRPSELASYFRIGKATAGRQLGWLEQLGLIVRQPDPEDGRAHRFQLTEDGEQRLSRERDKRQHMLREQLSTWPETDVAALGTLLERLNETLAGR